jgi:hypothetical protein
MRYSMRRGRISEEVKTRIRIVKRENEAPPHCTPTFSQRPRSY